MCGLKRNPVSSSEGKELKSHTVHLSPSPSCKQSLSTVWVCLPDQRFCTFDILGQKLFCWGQGLLCVLHSVSQHPWPLLTISQLHCLFRTALTTKNVSRLCQMSSGGNILPVEDHCSWCFKIHTLRESVEKSEMIGHLGGDLEREKKTNDKEKGTGA